MVMLTFSQVRPFVGYSFNGTGGGYPYPRGIAPVDRYTARDSNRREKIIDDWRNKQGQLDKSLCLVYVNGGTGWHVRTSCDEPCPEWRGLSVRGVGKPYRIPSHHNRMPVHNVTSPGASCRSQTLHYQYQGTGLREEILVDTDRTWQWRWMGMLAMCRLTVTPCAMTSSTDSGT